MAQGNSSASFDPLDVIPYADGLIPGGGAPVYCFNSTNVSELVDFRQAGEFSIEVCSRGYCRGDLRDSWFVANVDFPCVDNRQGPLCGQCKPGYAVTLYSTVCDILKLSKGEIDPMQSTIVAVYEPKLGNLI